jgi:hypothetical protein
MNYLKRPQHRSEAWRRYVASLPCFSCGVEGYSQCAHANYGKGMATKASDLDTFPLCCARPGIHGCHYLHDNCVGMTRAQRRDLETSYIERMQIQATIDKRNDIAP